MDHHVARWNRLFPEAWTVLVGAIALLLATPVLTVLSGILMNTGDVWAHLTTTVLPTYLWNSLWLMLGVSLGVTVIGTGTAWLVTMCRFWGSRVLEWALLLPLAAPAYILAYTYTELLEFYGPVQTTLRGWFGWESFSDYWFPNLRSLWGAILMLTLVLYPYVYLLARSAFLNQSLCTLEASRSLGCGPWRSFATVALPMARPAIIAGLSLALMETLNDYATVQYFSVDTFTTGIYRTWFGMGERIAASQLAACLLGFIAVLVLLERWSRGQARYFQTVNRHQALQTYHLRGLRAIAAQIACFMPVGLGLLLPAGILLKLALSSPDSDAADDFANATDSNARFWEFASNSLTLALLTAVIAVLIAVIMAYGIRLRANPVMQLGTRTAAMGYAVPGSVIAVGILVPLGRLDNQIDAWARSSLGISTGLLLSGTIAALVFAYLVRFLAVSLSSVEASLAAIKPSMDDAARSLGHGTTSTLVRVHTPLMWSGLFTAAVLVFVDVMKELPATLIVRPFNFDTLAIRVYNLASDERLAEAALPALAIVLVGLLPVVVLSFKIRQARRDSEQ
jgi:iron(III) transport system permease protein